MGTPDKDYARRAEEIEQLAAAANDSSVKLTYLALAAEFRMLAAAMARSPSGAEVGHLTDRMFGHPPGKL